MSITVAITVAVIIAAIVAATMSKSKTLEYLKFNTQILKLYKAIASAIDAISIDHWVRPRKNELFIYLKDAFIRIYNWGFI